MSIVTNHVAPNGAMVAALVGNLGLGLNIAGLLGIVVPVPMAGVSDAFAESIMPIGSALEDRLIESASTGRSPVDEPLKSDG